MRRWIPAVVLLLGGGCAWLGRATGVAVPAGPRAYACARSAAAGLGYSLRSQRTGEEGVQSFRGEKNVGGYGSDSWLAVLSVTVRHRKKGGETLQVGGRVEHPHTPEAGEDRASRRRGAGGWIGGGGRVAGVVVPRYDGSYAEEIVLSDAYEVRRECGGRD
jgi:hypothetical protein